MTSLKNYGNKMNFALKLQWRIQSYFNRFILLGEGEAWVVEGNRRAVLARCRAMPEHQSPALNDHQ